MNERVAFYGLQIAGEKVLFVVVAYALNFLADSLAFLDSLDGVLFYWEI